MDQITINRDSSFDLLRIICSIMVIIEHFCETGMLNGFGLVSTQGDNAGYMLYVILYSISRCAVDIFVMISGYFMIKKVEVKIGKIISLVIMTIIFNEFSYICGVISMNSMLSTRKLIAHLIPGNYYLSFYCVIYILAPYLNKIVKGFSVKKYAMFIVLLLTIFSLWPTLVYVIEYFTSTKLVGSFSVSLNGTDMGFNVVNFCILYYLGGFFQFCKRKIQNRSCLITAIICFCACCIIGVISTYSINGTNVFRYYDNPVIIAMAVSIIVLFNNINVNKRNILIPELGRATFGVFLLHFTVLKTIDSRIPIEDFFKATGGSSVLCIVFYVFIAYAISAIITIAYNRVTALIREKWLNNTKLYRISIMQ